MKKNLPSEVKNVISRYCELLQEESALQVYSVYLVGSLALKDYITGSSDVDFLTILKSAPDAAGILAMERLHLKLAKEIPHPKLEGFYITEKQAYSRPQYLGVAPFFHDGSFYVAESCYELNPVTWQILQNHALLVHGEGLDPEKIETSEKDLTHFSFENLSGYWAPWVKKLAAMLAMKKDLSSVNTVPLIWGVLGVCRVSHLLETGKISSKTEAGRWGARFYPEWSSIIEEVGLWRLQPSIKETDKIHAEQALAFMKSAIGIMLQRHSHLKKDP